MFKKLSSTILTLLGAFTAPLVVEAQGLESLGNRATALAAFVAIADDASAVAWNPAGLVSGPIFNISLDLGRSTSTPSDPTQSPGRAGRVGTTLLAIGTTPMGLTYYRLAHTTIAADPAVLESPDRQDRQVAVRTLVTNHLGATVQQSVGNYLTLGATVKLVRGSVGVGRGGVRTWQEAFERTDEFDPNGTTTGDVDIGAMFAAGGVRAGLLVRNVMEPTFGDKDVAQVTVQRHVRAGVAWADRWPGLSRLIVALDADLTRVPHAGGDRRDVATGVERWFRGQQIGVRGGVRASTVDGARPVASGGMSYAVRVGTYVDAYVMAGTGDVRGWGLAARMSY